MISLINDGVAQNKVHFLSRSTF